MKAKKLQHLPEADTGRRKGTCIKMRRETLGKVLI